MSHLARARLICLFLLSISFLFLNLSLHNRIQGLKNFFLYLASPSSSLATRMFLQGENLSKNFLLQLHLNEENRQLKEKLKEYVHLDTLSKEIIEENEQLRKILQFRERTKYDFISAQVLVRDTQDWYNSVIIDKGALAGIKKDLPVITLEGDKEGLLGRIIEVSPNASKILLLTDSLSAVVGYVPRSKVDGIVEGQGSKEMRFKYILPEMDLKSGDLIVTSGTGGIFPAGIPIGEIVKFEEKKYAPYKEAILTPQVDFSHLREVLVITE
jgi:rod shape-determining protein MreC